VLAFTNGGGYTWRTLTGNAKGEWDYVFSERSSGAIANGTTNAHYTYATINTDGTSVNGVRPQLRLAFHRGFIIMNTTAATQMAIPIAILTVKASPNRSVPIKIAVSGSNTPRTAVFVGPI